MEYSSVTINIRPDDIAAFRRVPLPPRKLRDTVLALVGLGGAAVTFCLDSRGAGNPETELFSSIVFWTLFSLLLLSLSLALFSRLIARSGFLWRKLARMHSPSVYRVLEKGLRVENDGGYCLTPWSAFERITESRKHFYLKETRGAGHIVPKRCFFTSKVAASFAETVRLLLQKNIHPASYHFRILNGQRLLCETRTGALKGMLRKEATPPGLRVFGASNPT